MVFDELSGKWLDRDMADLFVAGRFFEVNVARMVVRRSV